MKLNKILAGLLFSTIPLTPALAQQSKVLTGQELENIVANYKGSDTTILKNKRNYILKRNQFNDQYEIEQSANSEYTDQKDTLVIDEKSLAKFVNNKNHFIYETPRDAIISIINSRDQNYYIDQYFKLSTEKFPKPPLGSGVMVRGEEKVFYDDYKNTLNAMITEYQKTGKDTYDLERIMKYIDDKLGTVSGAADMKPGIYKVKYNDHYGVLVVVEYDAIIVDGQNRPNVRLLARTKLISNIQTNFKKDISSDLYTSGKEIIETKEKTSRNNNATQIHGRIAAMYTMIKNPDFTEKVLEKLPECEIDFSIYQKK